MFPPGAFEYTAGVEASIQSAEAIRTAHDKFLHAQTLGPRIS